MTLPGTVGHDPIQGFGPADSQILMLKDILVTLVRQDGRDLTARQLTAFLLIYTEDEVHTVSSIAERLNISRPGVTRVMDRLVHFDLLSREEDRADRRRVLARRTERGGLFSRELSLCARTGSDVQAFAATPARERERVKAH